MNAQPMHDKFVIAIDEREPIVQMVADMHRAGFEVDYATDPPTLRRAGTNEVPVTVRAPREHGAMPPGGSHTAA